VSARRTTRNEHSPAGRVRRPLDGYADLSASPLHVLVFLAPLLLLYEIGSILYLVDPSSGVVETIRARGIVARFFEFFGVVGLFLPGAALVAVLIAWHLLKGDRWRIRPGVLAGMAMESIAWTLPLLVMGVVVRDAIVGASMASMASAGATGPLEALPWQARLTIAVGAGLYEEMLFRLILIAAADFVLVDLLGVSSRSGRMAALLISAVAFTFYHDLGLPGGGVDVFRLVFYMLAGLYFGWIYLSRGLGIVVAVHAFYDILVLVLLRPHG